MKQVNETKEEIQSSWRAIWNSHGKKGTLAGATGIGKTKPAIDEMMALWKSWQTELKLVSYGAPSGPPCPKIFVAVPTEVLRDLNWPQEVEQWYGEEGLEMWRTCVQAECYISLHKIKGKRFDLVIMDEFHWITPLSYNFFKQNVCDAIMGLTATVPDKKRDPGKYDIIRKTAPVLFRYTLDQGVEDGVIHDFEITLISIPLDSVNATIKAGTKAKPFMTTERRHYDYLTKTLNQLFAQSTGTPAMEKRIMFQTLARSRFIYNLPSKTRAAAKLMDLVIKDRRTIVFCGSIKQSHDLCQEEVFHSKSKSTSKLEEFREGKGLVLGVVNAVNEGQNIKDLDQAIVVQVNSNERHIVQRIGRIVRLKDSEHPAQVWILYSRDTVDEKWVTKALQGIDPSKIRKIDFEDIESNPNLFT